MYMTKCSTSLLISGVQINVISIDKELDRLSFIAGRNAKWYSQILAVSLKY